MNDPQPMLTRRLLLRSAGLMAGAVALASCDTSPPGEGGGPTGQPDPAGGGDGSGSLQWWDQFNPMQELHQQTFERFTADGGPQVEHTVTNPNEQAQSLQLAAGSAQMPDVFTLAGVGVPPAVLHAQNWFAPLSNPDAITAALPEGSVVPGLHTFGGELYSFSIFSFRQYETLSWFNRSLLEQAGLDPENPPTSWDEYREAARALQESGESGLVLPLAFSGRMEAHVLEFAQTAGFPGSREGGTSGIDLTTGEYRFHDDAFVEAIEFLLSFQQDGLLFPASSSMDARDARARWAAGAAGFFFDGPWNAGVVSGDFGEFLPQLGVGPVPTPNGDAPVLTRPPTGGTFWISAESDQVEQASALLELFVGEEYQQGLAEAMDQPPLDLDSVAGSGAEETYKRAIEMYREQVFLGPTPYARNPLVMEVEAAMTATEPGLGQIIQGAFSGDIGDLRGALQELSDKMSQERDRAIGEVGGEISVDDWAFPDWSPGADYVVEAE